MRAFVFISMQVGEKMEGLDAGCEVWKEGGWAQFLAGALGLPSSWLG